MIEEIEDLCRELLKYDKNLYNNLEKYQKINDIIFNNTNDSFTFDDQEGTYQKKSKSIIKAYKFLNNLSPYYGEEFLKAYYEGKLNFYLNNREELDEKVTYLNKNYYLDNDPNFEANNNYANFDYDTFEKTIHVVFSNIERDTQYIIHEFIHYIVMDGNDSFEYEILCEIPSIASEFLYEKHNLKEDGKYAEVNSRLFNSIYYSYIMKVKLEYLKRIKDTNTIVKNNSIKVDGIINEDLYEIIKYLIMEEELDVNEELKYIIGVVTSISSITSLKTLKNSIELLHNNPKFLYLTSLLINA